MKTFESRQFINHDSEFSKVLRHLPSIDSDGPWVAGGSVWKSIENVPIEQHDIDFFFKSAEQCERWYRELLSMPYVHRIVSTPKSNSYNTTLKYHVHSRGFNKTVKIQLISFCFYKNIEELFNGFDFTACQFALDGQTLYTGDTSFEDVRSRQIIFNNVRDTYATAIHLEKYLKLGFNIPQSQIQKYEEIIGVRKAKEESPSPFVSIFDTTLGSRPAIREDGDEDDSAYPINNTANNAVDGIDLVRATRIPPRRQSEPRRTVLDGVISISPPIWRDSSPPSMPTSNDVLEPPVDMNNLSNTLRSINESYYTNVVLEGMSAVESPPLAGESGVVYSDYIPITQTNTL